MKALELKLIRYRGGEDSDYLYFWTERRGEVDVHVSPMFESQEDAMAWHDEFQEKVKACMSKLGHIKTG